MELVIAITPYYSIGRDLYIDSSNGGFSKNFKLVKGGYELGINYKYTLIIRLTLSNTEEYIFS